LLVSLQASAQDSSSHRFDGMSAIEIRLIASQQPTSLPGDASKTLDSTTSAGPGTAFLRCDLVELKGHPLHQGEFPIPGEPLPGDTQARVEFNQFVHSTSFRLLNESGESLENITLDPPGNQTASSTYQGGFTVPVVPFRIAASGQDLNNQAFEASCERLYSPQSVELRLDPENALVSAGDYEFNGVITNHGTQATFNFSASSDIGITVTPSSDSIELGPDESAPFTLSLVIPQISSGVLDIAVTVIAEAEGNLNLHNQASSTLWIERFEGVFGDNFE